jgi:hypothetical protein
MQPIQTTFGFLGLGWWTSRLSPSASSAVAISSAFPLRPSNRRACDGRSLQRAAGRKPADAPLACLMSVPQLSRGFSRRRPTAAHCAARLALAEMEYNGKRVDVSGELPSLITLAGAVGEPANQRQHRLFQTLHQGNQRGPG